MKKNSLMLLGFAAVFALGTACFTPSSQPDKSALAAAWARRPEAQRTSTHYLGPHSRTSRPSALALLLAGATAIVWLRRQPAIARPTPS